MKQKKQTKEKRKKKSSICKIPREVTLVRFEPNFCQLAILKFSSQINYEKVWDTLTALNFIVVIAKTVLKLFSFLALGDPDASLV